jgi:hypothetical protein
MAHDQTSLASDIELVTLVPAVDNAVPEHSQRSSSIDLGATRSSTAAAAYPTRIETTTLRGEASSLQSDKPSWIRRLILDSWLCECVAMCFSIGCLVATLFVVAFFDGDKIPLPQLPPGVSLNAIVSVLSNAARASLVFVVSATMGQLKWCWLRKSGRQIHDIQAMDDASRGPIGTFGVLFSWVGGSLAALGSIITLLLIAFGPFLQLLVEYATYTVTRPDPFAQAPRNLAYTHHLPLVSFDTLSHPASPWEENTELVHVLEAGVWSVPKLFDQEPTCPTHECYWREFQSIGWCSKCENRTYSATINNCKLGNIIQGKDALSEYCVLSLGHGANFSLLGSWEMTKEYGDDGEYSAYGNVTSEAIWPLSYGTSGSRLTGFYPPERSSKSTTLLDVIDPAIAMGHAIVRQDDNENYDLAFDYLQIVEASLCILHPCEKTLELHKVNGTTKWKDVSTNYGRLIARNVSFTNTKQSTSAGEIVRTNLCWQAEDGDLDLDFFDEENYAVDNSKRAFCPVEDYAYDIQRSLQGRYDSTIHVEAEKNGHVVLNTTMIVAGDPDAPYGYRSGRFNTVGPESTRNLSQRMENVAVALTNWGLQTSNMTVSGYASSTDAFSLIHVRWQWILFPAFLELATLALLILTIMKSRREKVPLWKSSVLALIYHAVDELHGQESLATERLSGMEVTAKTVDVQLVKSEDGVNSLSKRSGYRAVDQDE